MFILISLFVLANSMNCTINGVDYSRLIRSVDNPYVSQHPRYLFWLNICGDVDNNGNSVKAFKINNEYSLGQTSSQESFEDKYGIGFKYYHGSECDNGYEWSSTIYLHCDTEIKENDVNIEVLRYDFDLCSVDFQFSSKEICTLQNKETSSSLIIILSICLAIIIILILCATIIGIIIYRYKKNKSNPYGSTRMTLK